MSKDTSHLSLRLIVTTDLHMQLIDFDYFADRETGAQSLSHLGPVIRRLKAEASGAMLFDLGDGLQGNPLADHIAAQGLDARGHPLVRAMNRLGYDAMVPGNHEFDYGLAFARDALSPLDARIVCANLSQTDGSPGPAPFTVIERTLTDGAGEAHRLRIAVVGFTTPAVTCDEVVVEDILDAARTVLPAIQRESPDLTVALCHSGIAGVTRTPQMENAAVPLAALPGIDVVLAGHTHDIFPGPDVPPEKDIIDSDAGTLHGKPALMAGSYARGVGCLDLTLARGNAGWRIAGHRPRFIAPDQTPCDTLRADIEPLHAATRAALAEPVGETRTALHTWFEAMGLDMTGPLIAEAHRAYATERLGAEAPPVLVAVPAFRAGGRSASTDFLHIPAGPVLLRHVAALTPFDNPLCLVTRWGWQVRDWLEHAVGRFRQVPKGAEAHPLLDVDRPGYHMDTLHGLTYRIDLGAPPLFTRTGARADPGPGRIRDLRHEGRAVEDDDLFLVVTTTYRARGGGALAPIPASDIIHTAGMGARDHLLRYVARHSPLAPAPTPIWSFAPMPGVSVQFNTDRAAADHLPPGVRAIGEAPKGRIAVVLDL